MAPRKNYQRRNYNRKPPRKTAQAKQKKLVTGQEPSFVEKLANGAGQVAKLASAIMPIVTAINTEHKYYDQTAAVNAYTPGTNDVFVELSAGIAQGTTDSTRIGNSILAQDIQLRLAMSFTSTLGPPVVNGIHCRMLLICWKGNRQEDQPSVAKIFEAPTNLYSCVNKDFSDGFVVLKDKYFTLNATTSNVGTQAFTTMKVFKKIGWHMRYDGATTLDATQNHISLILRSSATGIGTSLACTYYSRLNYTDN